MYQKVRDHCHYTGKFREAANYICNLQYKVTKKIPVVFHNGLTYDYHFIIKQLTEECKGQLQKIKKNILLFHYRLKKKLLMVKKKMIVKKKKLLMVKKKKIIVKNKKMMTIVKQKKKKPPTN